ncbi:MAG TPA: hypothetical protein VMS37_11110 [Verrucomicrobiae bacterium]|nr:hypothetical protein [Verrucomicrobiae bacterium]
MAGLALAQDQTQRVDFPAGGVLHVKKLAGELTIEGWDQPGLEITAAQSAAVNAERKGEEVLVTPVSSGHTMMDLEYRIRLPYSARLVVEHGKGEVHVVNVTGDCRVTVSSGGITMDLPEGAYAIDAKSSFGGVVSEFDGTGKRARWLTGHRFSSEPAGTTHKLYLRAGYGDILLMKVPKGLGPGPERQAEERH